MASENHDFGGLRVAAFESRRAEDMARLIKRHGGVPSVSPSMREVPVSDHRAAVDFAHRLISGQIDIVLLMTGVGTRHLVAQIERHMDRQRFVDALADATTIVRGPKPLAALRELGLQATWQVPQPNTWREVLDVVDRQAPVYNLTVAVQEYGLPNTSLVAGLEARGAHVQTIKVYDWDLPLDTQPLEGNIQALAAGRIDVALFTSAHQVVNLLRLAEQLNMLGALREACPRLVVGSIGPTTSEMLRECDWPVDVEPEHSKMGHLVSAAAARSRGLVAAKRRPTNKHVWGETQAATDVPRAAWHDSPFMKACRREAAARVPIWLMRQAGRYMPEYRQIRARTGFLELCKNPALCAEVMVTAVRRLSVDAAIVFADLLPILEPMGLALSFGEGEGPVIHNPLECPADVDRVRELESVEPLDFTLQAVRLTRAELPADIPLLGFAGAPFTLASYAIEGGASRNYERTKSLMYADEGAWNALLARLARAVTRYLNAQIDAGAQAVQLFDSWVGCLGPDDYRRYVLPHVRSIVQGINPTAPVINFATGNPALLPLLSEAGGAVIGIDWRDRLDDAWRTVGYDKAVQGNLDPAVLLAEPAEIRRRAAEVLRQAAGRPGHIFNLGHGVLKQTPVDHAVALVEAVHELGSAQTE